MLLEGFWVDGHSGDTLHILSKLFLRKQDNLLKPLLFLSLLFVNISLSGFSLLFANLTTGKTVIQYLLRLWVNRHAYFGGEHRLHGV